MPLFEITRVSLATAVVLMRVANSLRVPYPSMLALAGGCVAVLPFAPYIGIEPHLAMALFVAPAVMDTAFDMPPRELTRNWLPLTSLAVVLVKSPTRLLRRKSTTIRGATRLCASAGNMTQSFRRRPCHKGRPTAAAIPGDSG